MLQDCDGESSLFSTEIVSYPNTAPNKRIYESENSEDTSNKQTRNGRDSVNYSYEVSDFKWWWCTEYRKDIQKSLREKEQNLRKFHLKSPQNNYRSRLVDFMVSVGEYKELNRTTVHLSVYLLDVFMDNHNIYEDRLKLVALVCILLSAVIEERECKIPKLSELNNLISNKYTVAEFYKLEYMILKFMDYNIIIPTAAHFIDIFLPIAIHDMRCIESRNLDDLTTTLIDRIMEFVYIILFDTDLMHIPGSKTASACIAAGRQELNLMNVWNSQLEKITKYKLSEIEDIVCVLIQMKRDNATINKSTSSIYLACITKIEKNPINKRKILDSGYQSDSDDDMLNDHPTTT